MDNNLTQRKEKLIKFFSNKYTLILIGILLFAFILRLYYFNMPEAVWWDEASYLTRAKSFGGIINVEDGGWSARRPFLLPLLWGMLYGIGANELVIRLTMLIFSMFGVYLTYLVGREMFNKKIGLIAAFGMAVFWQHLFFTGRLLTGLPTTTFWLACVYYFWKGYANLKEDSKSNLKYLCLAGLFAGLAVFARGSSALIAIPLGLFIIVKERHRFVLNKNLWIMVAIALLVLSPFLIYLQATGGNIISRFTGVGEGRFSETMQTPQIMNYIKFFPDYLTLSYFLVFLIGLWVFVNLFLGFDLLIKGKDKEGAIGKYFFLLIWILTFLIFFGFFAGFEPRYLMYIFPAVFMIMAQGLMIIHRFLKRFDKRIALAAVILILAIGGYSQIGKADDVIKNKAFSFYQLKPAGEWMKYDLKEGESIITTSNQMELFYYTEKMAYHFGGDEQTVLNRIEEHKPKYLVISIFFSNEPWMYEFPQKYQEFLIPVQAFFLDEAKTQPAVVIYQINYNNFNLDNALKKAS